MFNLIYFLKHLYQDHIKNSRQILWFLVLATCQVFLSTVSVPSLFVATENRLVRVMQSYQSIEVRTKEALFSFFELMALTSQVW